MKKGLIIALSVAAGIIAFVVILVVILGNAAAQEYTLGRDSVPSIAAIVGKRNVTHTALSSQNDVTTMTITYKSDTPHEDLTTYTNFLRSETGGFVLIEEHPFANPPSLEFGRPSAEQGHIIILIIEYNLSGYTIIINKGVGEFYFG
jgi:hypothetical protein